MVQNAYAIILAGGSGQRMGIKDNKVYLPLHGVPALIRCIKPFQAEGLGIVLVIRPEDEGLCHALLSQYGLLKALSAIVFGGATRQASVYNGLTALPDTAHTVLVHDGARALVTGEIIRRVLHSTKTHGTGIAAVPLKDTIKEVNPRMEVTSTPDRARYMAVQTPQGFTRDLLTRAHLHAQQADLTCTDDAALVEAMGHTVHLVQGSYTNLKLTTAEDVITMEGLLAKQEDTLLPSLRIGQGYDVHKLAPDRKLILCGITVPHETGLLGYSDADVALHALMDALLGAAALGDIGRHFPDNDPAYKGISSMTLLSQVMQTLASHHLAPGNVDITIVAQRPKLSPFIPQMQQNVAQALALPLTRVNVKATTTERLGFEGQELGISAHAVCLLMEVR